MPDPVEAIVFAFAAMAGAPSLLHLLFDFEGRIPGLDIDVCVFLIAAFVGFVLAIVLLLRFMRLTDVRTYAAQLLAKMAVVVALVFVVLGTQLLVLVLVLLLTASNSGSARGLDGVCVATPSVILERSVLGEFLSRALFPLK